MFDLIGIYGFVILLCIFYAGINYKLEDKYLAIRSYGFTFRKVYYQNIRWAKKGKHYAIGEHWGNYLFRYKKFITIYKKSYLFNYLMITPNDPDRFLNDLQLRISNNQFHNTG